MSVSDFGVLFDVDGVLIDSYAAHLKTWQICCQRHGRECTEAQFAAGFGRFSSRGLPGLAFPHLFVLFWKTRRLGLKRPLPLVQNASEWFREDTHGISCTGLMIE